MSSLSDALDQAWARNEQAEAVANDLQRQVELAQARNEPEAVVQTLKSQLDSAVDRARDTWQDVNDIRDAMHR
jgi:F0F1-type ATP synthase membrane subunit b/b'